MSGGKIVLCRCEDVTLHDVVHAVERGYADLEEVKRYTGFGTGPCQGKECLGPIAIQLARLTACAPSTIAPFTARPPLQPTPLKLFATDPSAHVFTDDEEPDHEGGP